MSAEEISYNDAHLTMHELPIDHDAAEYSIGKQRYDRIRIASTEGMLEKHYKILFDSPIPQHSSEFADAYSVATAENTKIEELYALVFKHNYPARISDINHLAMKLHPNFCCILSSQIVHFSEKNASFLCAIIQKPKGIPLRRYIAENGPLSEKVLTQAILPAINSTIEFLDRHHITHGCINPDTIYITEDKEIYVDECISKPCGYLQLPHYEKVNRIYADPLGKGSGNYTVDLFSLGMLTTYLHTGKDFLADISLDEIIRIKLEETSYHFIVSKHNFSQHLIDFLKGALVEESSSSWGIGQTALWIGGREFNSLPPSPTKESSRPITFMGKQINNRKTLAYYLWKNWDEAKKFITGNHLISWMEHNVKEIALAEKMEALAKKVHIEEVGVSNFDKEDLLLTHYLILLDPNGPLRVKNLALHVEGIGTRFAKSYLSNENDRERTIHMLQLVLKHNLIQIWNDVCYTLGEKGGQDAIQNLQKCREIYYKRDKGFGMIRCLYELNHSLCCQSSLINNENCLTIYHLLNALENSKLDHEQIIDEHIWAFLATKLELTVNVKLNKLQKYPELMTSQSIQTLSILALAQEATDSLKLPKLSMLLASSLENVVNIYHGRMIRKEFRAIVEKISAYGSLSRLLKTAIDTKFILRDKIGFKRAVRQYQMNKLYMLRLDNIEVVNKIGYRYGLQLSVIISFLIAAGTVIILMSRVAL